MTSKKVWQYQCDHCGKKMYSAPHMYKHESSCTMNPNRNCRMCKRMGLKQKPMAMLINVLKPLQDDEDFLRVQIDHEASKIQKLKAEKALAMLELVSGGCPVCMFAALRQGNLHCEFNQWFRFKERMEKLKRKMYFDN